LCKRLHNFGLSSERTGIKIILITRKANKMDQFSTSQTVNESNKEKVKTHLHDYANSKISQEFNHQRVSVKDIIVNHYRKGR
jgi:hypothetical protein